MFTELVINGCVPKWLLVMQTLHSQLDQERKKQKFPSLPLNIRSSSDCMMSSCSTHQHLLFFLLLLLLITNYLHIPHQVTSISFNYTPFDRGNITEDARSCPEGIHKICLKEDATQLDADHSIQFTNASSSSGYAVYSEALPLWKWEEDDDTTTTTTGDESRKVTTNFTTRFSFNLISSNERCNVTSGIAFFLSHHPHRIPPDHNGAMLGLVSEPNKTSASVDSSFIAVEVDTHPDSMWDPSYIHLGINVNDIKSKVVGNISALSSEADGRIVGEVQVVYDSLTGNLTATVEHGNKVYANISYHIDLSSILPELVAIGISATTWYCTESSKVTSWSFDSTWDRVVPERKRENVVVALIAFVVLGSITLLGLLCLVARWRGKQVTVMEMEGGDSEEDSDANMIIEEAFTDTGAPRRLEYDDLVASTGNFDEQRKLGGGGSGTVYHGCLRGLNRQVAIKRVSSGGDSKRSKKEYMAEVKVISRLRHRNLVQLVGWCHDNGEFLLAYECMPNLSLDRHLFGHGGGAILTWPVRYNIALGVASALLYLHEEGDRCVVHRDVKSSNVMLDENFNAKLGDFGLARLTDHGRGLRTTILGGTLGYMAPECFFTRRASIESDVYAFGVVALEIATGRRAITREGEKKGNQMVRLVQWVWNLFAKGAILEAADQRLDIDPIDQKSQMERLLVVGLWCAHPDAQCRPTIRKATAALNHEDVKIDLPMEMPVAVYAVPERRGKMTWQLSSSLANYTVSSLYYDGR